MLAQAGTVTDALEAWDEPAVEWKYDGARIQLHYDGERTRLFSRNMEDVTNALPEVVEFANQTLRSPTILDGEGVAIDEVGDPLPFQVVLRRFRRKHDVERAREEDEVRPVFFDCLLADGEQLLDAPLTDRHSRLEAALASGIAEHPAAKRAMTSRDSRACGLPVTPPRSRRSTPTHSRPVTKGSCSKIPTRRTRRVDVVSAGSSENRTSRRSTWSSREPSGVKVDAPRTWERSCCRCETETSSKRSERSRPVSPTKRSLR